MRWMKWGFTFALVVVLCPWGISRLNGTEMAPEVSGEAGMPTSIRRAETSRVDDVLHAFGHVTPAELVSVSMPSHTAPVSEVLVQEGAMVREGQVLARLDTLELKSDLRHAEANLSVAQAEIVTAQALLERVKADIEQRRSELERFERLAQRGILSEVQRQDAERALERAVLDLDAAGGRLEKARASETLARTEVDRVKRLITQTDLKAPVPGRVMQVGLQVGETPATGSNVFSLARDDRMEAVLSVAPHALDQVSLGDRVRLWTPDGRMVDGKIGKISPALRPENRLARVVVPLPKHLSAGAGASIRGEIVIAERFAVVVPISALVALKSGPGVFRVVAGRAVATPVSVALRPGGAKAEIVEGLTEGAVYVSVASPLMGDDEPVAGILEPEDIELKRTATLYPGGSNR